MLELSRDIEHEARRNAGSLNHTDEMPAGLIDHRQPFRGQLLHSAQRLLFLDRRRHCVLEADESRIGAQSLECAFIASVECIGESGSLFDSRFAWQRMALQWILQQELRIVDRVQRRH